MRLAGWDPHEFTPAEFTPGRTLADADADADPDADADADPAQAERKAAIGTEMSTLVPQPGTSAVASHPLYFAARAATASG
jgi:hypothetical protein